MRRTHGFTLIELLVVIAIIALLIGLLLPALAKAQRTSITLKDATQVKEIHQSMLIYANDQTSGRLPLPGLIDRLLDPYTQRDLPGQGPEDVTVNHTGPLYSALVAQEFFNTDILISPAEVNPVVQQYEDYRYDEYDPAADSYWDDELVAFLDGEVCHTSYAHMALCGKRKDLRWRNTQASGDPIVGSRGTGGVYDSPIGTGPGGAVEGPDYTASPTLELHGPDEEWVGNICFNDNHTEIINNFFPKLTSYEPATTTGAPTKDNIFSAEFPQDFGEGQAGNDAYLVICTASTDTSVTAVYDELVP